MGPNLTIWRTQPLNKTAISYGQKAKPVLANMELGKELFDLLKQDWMHAHSVTVHANACKSNTLQTAHAKA